MVIMKEAFPEFKKWMVKEISKRGVDGWYITTREIASRFPYRREDKTRLSHVTISKYINHLRDEGIISEKPDPRYVLKK